MRRVIKVCKCKYLVGAFFSCIACMAHSSNQTQRNRMSPEIREPEELSPYQLPARFLGEIHIVLSCLVIACSIGTTVSLYIKLPEEESEARLLDMGFILFLCITLLVSVMDVCLSVLLICASIKASLERSLLWQRFTITLLIGYSILTVGFGVLLSTSLVILALIPSLIYKPFSLWVVEGFVQDLQCRIRNSMLESERLTLQASEDARKSTTVFILNKDSTTDIVESKALLTKASQAQTNMKTPS